jgi:type IV pilus assembly protein PilC
MALMLHSGLTMLETLEVCRDHAAKPRLEAIIVRLINSVQSGNCLSQAMGMERLFSTLSVRLIESAEASGELDRSLTQIAQHLQRRKELFTRLVTTLIYPTIVVITAIAVALFLVISVIPKFAAFLARRQMELPWTTQLLVSVSKFMIQYGWYLAAAVLMLIVAASVIWATRDGRRAIDRVLLGVPIVGKLLTIGAMIQFTHTLSVLLRSGLTLLDSLKIAAQVVSNRAIAAQMTLAAQKVLNGNDLSSSLRHPVIPLLVTRMIAVGERAGTLSQILGELGTFYDEQLQTRLRRMMALVEPALILIIGGMVGFVYYSFFQVIVQLAGGR